MRTLKFIVLCSLAALSAGVVACSASAPPGQPVIVDGSSTVFPISQAAVAEFHKNSAHAQQPVTVTSSSTGVGLKRFCAGELDVADASRHIKDSELAACTAANVQFVELPIAYDAICIVVSHSNTWASSITVPELKKLWQPAAQGKITKWSQIHAGWPDKAIHLVGPDNESGTFDYFNEMINGAPKSSRTDYSANEDDNKIIATVEGDELALGYVGFTYYDKDKTRLKALAVDDLNDQIGPGPVEVSLTNVRRGIYMPLSRPVFIYVRASSLARPEVQQFADFYVRFAPQIVEQADGIRLSPREGELSLARLTKRVLGTMFAGPEDADVSLEIRLSTK